MPPLHRAPGRSRTRLSPVSMTGGPDQAQCWWRSPEGCDAAAEGRASPSSGSYSAEGPAQGWPPGTAGRRAGQRGSRRRQSGRNSRSGERAGPGKAGRGMWSGAAPGQARWAALARTLALTSCTIPSREASPGLASALLPPLGARRHRQHSAVSPSHPHLSPRTSGRVTAPNSHTGLGR